MDSTFWRKRRTNVKKRRSPLGELGRTGTFAALMTLCLACPPAAMPVIEDALTANSQDLPMPTMPTEVEYFEHSSGLGVLFQPVHAAPVVAYQVWVRVGSGDETDREAGLAHVHEHMLFKGTESRAVGEIARDIEAIGGSINAWTSFDQTVYHIVVPSRFADEGLDVLADAVANSAFDPTELERELEVIQEEIRRSEDLPSRALNRLLFDNAYTDHPYGRPVIGSRESVASFTRDDVLSFFERWYRPENMTLVVVGDVERSSVEATLDTHFRRSRHAAPARPDRPVEPQQNGLRVASEFRDVQDGHVALAFHAPDLAHEDTPALEVLAILLGQGESSILFENVQRRAGLTNSVYGYLYSPAEPGIFMLGASYSGADEDTDAQKVLSALTQEIARLRHRDIPASDIRRALTILESDRVYQRQTVQGIAQRLGYFHTVAGGIGFERRFVELARRVTPGDLRRVAQQYFNIDNLTVAMVLPDGENHEFAEPARVDDVVKAAYAASDDEFGSFDLTPDAYGAVRHVFDNGLVAIIQHDETAPLFGVRAAVMGGLLAEDEANAGISNLLAHMLTAGTDARSAPAIALEIDSIAASLSGFSGRNTVGMRMTALSRDFESAMEIFADTALHSTFPGDELDRVRREILADIAAQPDNLAGTAFRMFNEQTYVGHPYAMSVLGTEETVGGVNRSELIEFYRRMVQPSRMVISVVGDIEPDRALRVIQELMVDTAAAAPRDLAPRPTPAPATAARLTESRDRQQSHVVLGYQTESMDGELRYALDVLGAILGGQGGRLFLELRDRQSLAYSVNAYASSGLDAGTFAFYIATSPNKVEQALGAIREQMRLLREHGVTDEELVRAQRYLVGRRDIGLQRQSARAGYYTFDELYGRGFDHGYNYAERIDAVTAEQIRDAVVRYFDPEREVVVVVGPELPAEAAQADAE